MNTQEIVKELLIARVIARWNQDTGANIGPATVTDWYSNCVSLAEAINKVVAKQIP